MPSLPAPTETDPPAPRPTAPDTRAGRPTLAFQLGLQRLMGSAERGLPHGDVVQWGQAPGVQLTYPFRRDFAAELWGAYGSFEADSECRGGCKGSTLAFGLGAVYHMVDGIPFDPWFSVGLGYRRTILDTPGLGRIEYEGITALRLMMGSDYYPTPILGFGPYLEFTAGRYLSRSPEPLLQGEGHTTFATGLRVVWNPF
ncbi:MAG: hypothetical protein RMJ98_12850 [Myxococcales bacterium]|nr:hypothetical protein [Polyangiaceae bacterium]MDW8250175.1 hypothetical protein [Myxococcales bacterium]